MALTKLQGRYEIRQTLGKGGMGVVYRAWDSVIRREVALKTLRDAPSRDALDLFRRECEVLASISHPNIIEIFDLGEFEEDGVQKPYFVMPLLPGQTLESLIRAASPRLTLERVIDIISQTCRGLQAAHEKGLVHRDVKPSNVFVMDDDSVKVIDFGVARMADTQSTMGHKGTLLYMSPEQIEMKPASALSDLFSVAAVSYEALTGRRPFERPTQAGVIRAILSESPAPAYEINPAVGQPVSRVLHKALAKQPWYRFSGVREFSDALQKALRNEPLEFFDQARVQPRIERAARAYEEGDLAYASELLAELEAEGHLAPEISALRRRIDAAARQQAVAQLLKSARVRLEEQEFPMALQKVTEALDLDPKNADALALKSILEKKQREQKTEDWLRLAHMHLENRAYIHAREALQNLLSFNASETRATELMAEVDRREQEHRRLRQEKAKLYDAALEAYHGGELSSALVKMERLLELDRAAPDTSSDTATGHQRFYQQVRGEHEAINSAYARARKHIADRDIAAALAICGEFLERYPNHALFQSLKFDIEELGRQELSARIAEISRAVETEPDLDRRVSMLDEAVRLYPGESYFERSLKLARDKRDLVAAITAKARVLEERGQLQEALGQWETLTHIYGQYPGLSLEIERLARTRDQQARLEAKTLCMEEIERLIEHNDYARALRRYKAACEEFPGDPELTQLGALASQRAERTVKAQELLDEGVSLCSAGLTDEGLAKLRQACESDPNNAAVRAALLQNLSERARAAVEQDWRVAQDFARQALELDPNFAAARSALAAALECKREEEVGQALAEGFQLQGESRLTEALERVTRALADYPGEMRLLRLQLTLQSALPPPAAQIIPQPGGPPAEFPASEPAPLAPAEMVGRPAGRLPALNWKLWAGIAAGGLILVAAATWSTVAMARKFRLPVLSVAGNPVEIRTTPPGALIRVNNEARGQSNARLELPPGSYVVEALLDGYHPASVPLTVRRGMAEIVEIPLRPMAQMLQLFTDLDGATAALDSQTPASPPGGQLLLPNLPPGRHVLAVAARGAALKVEFELVPGAPPAAVAPAPSEAYTAILVAGCGGRTRVYSSLVPAKATVDGRAAGEVGPAPLELTGLTSGVHELVLAGEKAKRQISFESSAAPTLSVFVQSLRAAGKAARP